MIDVGLVKQFACNYTTKNIRVSGNVAALNQLVAG
jgi:hypothetical protein